MCLIFFFNDTATTEIYTLSLHDALPIFQRTFVQQVETLAKLRRGGEQKVTVEHVHVHAGGQAVVGAVTSGLPLAGSGEIPKDRKSTRLNSRHANISYGVFCL